MEYENQAVPASAQKDWRSFLGMYAGEHAAGTEFMIGPLFLTAGVSAFDLIIGLLLGNLLAVLSWRFLTAEIAVSHRLTLYYQLEKICGKSLVKGYNLANGILFCFLAGAMVTVSATAVGVPFDMKMPSLTDTWPASFSWVIIVIIIGVLISLIAARGYQMVAKAANWMAPLIVLSFIAAGWVALNRLEVSSFKDFWAIWGEGSDPFPGQIKYSFWHVVIWSWFCNAAMHIGMSDLSVFRFAKKSSAGWTTAAGMYIGHYIAWIAAALLYTLYLESAEAKAILAAGGAPPVAPGPLAYEALGIWGIIAVVLAGWTTANPTIYRAGLAFQGIVKNSKASHMTLLAGALATVAGIFPAFAMQLLGFVAFYGFVLAPVGAIIAVEHFLGKPLKLRVRLAEELDLQFNLRFLIAWSVSVLFFYLLALKFDIFLSFLILPAWLMTGLLHILLNRRPAA